MSRTHVCFNTKQLKNCDRYVQNKHLHVLHIICFCYSSQQASNVPQKIQIAIFKSSNLIKSSNLFISSHIFR